MRNAHWIAVVTLALSTALAGCAGKLVVTDADGKPAKGMPFRAAEVYLKKGTYSKHSKGDACDPTPFVDLVALPTGTQYFVTAETAQFAKTAFHIKYADNGAVSEVGLDSEPAAAETLKAVAELYKVIRPAPAVATESAALKLAKACDVGETNVTYERFKSN